jgi:hypothetical protein
MELQKPQAVDAPELIDRCYETLHQLIQKSPSQNRLIKQVGWIATCAHEAVCDPARMLRIVQEYGYPEFTAASWGYVDPIVRLIKATSSPQAETWSGNPFSMPDMYWYVLFPPMPDWLILYAASEDFWVIAGKPDFAGAMLGVPPEKAYADLQDFADASKWGTDHGRSLFAHLIYQLQVAYPAAQPGEAIDFWPL